MSPLLASLLLYLAVGFAEWWLALRRSLACARIVTPSSPEQMRREICVLVSIVFFENMLGLWVLSNFVRSNCWQLALSYSAGGSLGALTVALMQRKSNAGKPKPDDP